MVPVVPSFSDGAVGDDRIFAGVGKNIIGVVTVQMCRRVDQPSKVKDDAIPKGTGNKEGIPEILPPKVGSNLRWEDIADVKSEPGVQLSLEDNTPILQEITEIHFSSSLDYIGMLLDHKPSHVGVEESPGSVVGISIGFGVFVVDAMVTTPVVDTSLVGKRVAKHQEESDGPSSFVGSVRP